MPKKANGKKGKPQRGQKPARVEKAAPGRPQPTRPGASRGPGSSTSVPEVQRQPIGPEQPGGDGVGGAAKLAPPNLVRQNVDQPDAVPEHQPQQFGPTFTIVGVGASAGGLEAFTQLLRALPADALVAVVYIQHLAPRYESSLAALLSQATTMPVAQATDQMPIKPGHVYVIPPNAFLSITSGMLRLTPRPEGRAQHAPIDYFFRSLAQYAQQRAVGVVLSGTDSDGSTGLREIKAVGGITLAQEPSTAKFDGMPRAAISTGAVDAVMPPEAIARELARIAKHPLLRHIKAKTREREVAISEDHWQRIFSLLRGKSGVDFTHYKQPTIRRRLQRRMVLNKTNSIEGYLRHLEQNPAEVQALYQDILIHVTRFFREPESYDFLAAKVFPQIVRDRRKSDKAVRIWVPGCSTGEEAYSIAMCLLEFLGDDATATPVQVFATDVSESAIDQARSGIFPESIAGDVSPERLRRFFNRVDGSFRISKPVRDVVIFARQDLTRDPPFSKLDLIVCRNVLIYLGLALQKKLMGVFHYALKPTGYLMLGASETIGPHSDLFALADKKFKVYTKKTAGARTYMDFVPAAAYLPQRPEVVAAPIPGPRAGPSILNEANRILLGRYAPPSVLVDEDLQILQFRGQTGPYLEPAPGEASLNLLKMAREGLLYDLRAALNDGKKTGRPARRENLHVHYSGRVLNVNVEVVPITAFNDRRHFLVTFEDVSPAADDHAGAGKPGGKRGAAAKPRKQPVDKSARPGTAESSERMLRLQQELAASREYLQSIIQDLEAANEELQSANEEILSSNEELQSTNEELDTAKEELQSTNEELNTVNEELQGRNEELSRVNSDLVNLLSSVQIAVVMVTSDLRIRRFTPMAEKLLNLIPTDLGRPIGDIKPNVDLPDLEKLITESVDSVSAIEREVKDRSGLLYLARIRPYKNLENRIDGAVITLFDLDMARRHDRAPMDIQNALDGILSLSRQSLLVLDERARVLAMSESFAKTFKISPEGTIGRAVYDLPGNDWNVPRLHELLEHVLPDKGRISDFRLEHALQGVSRVTLQIDGRQFRHEGVPDLVVLAINLMEPSAGTG